MNPRCAICSSESSLYLCAKDYNRRITEDDFRYYQCPECRIVFLCPVPGDLDVFYPPEYYSLPTSLEELHRWAMPERYKIELITRYVPTGRLLEIGPAWGNFSYLAKQAGFEVDAIEMDERCCRFLAEVVGIRVINSRDAGAVLAQTDTASYDVIALWHVLEHLPDPWTVLESAVARLLPGGILVIAAPNPDSWQFRIQGKYWPHLDAPRHVSLIPMQLLNHRMQSQGLTAVLNTTSDEGSRGWNIFGWRQFLSNGSDNRFIKMGLRALGTLVSIAARPFEQKSGNGSTYTAIYRKEVLR